MALFGLIAMMPAPLEPIESAHAEEQESVEEKQGTEKPSKDKHKPKTDNVASEPEKPEFDPQDEATWPTCKDNEIVRADNGKCAKRATPKKVETVSQPTRSEPEPAPRGSCEAEIQKYDWNKTVAVNVSRAESGLRSSARGDTTLTYHSNGVRYGDSWGCFQIRHLPGRPSPSQLTNAEFNVKYAYDMYKGQGWSPWSVCRHTVSCY